MKLNAKIMIVALIGLNIGLIQAGNINYALANNADTISADIANLGAIMYDNKYQERPNGLYNLILYITKDYCPKNKCASNLAGTTFYAISYQDVGDFFGVDAQGITEIINNLSINNVSISTVNDLISNYGAVLNLLNTFNAAIGIPPISGTNNNYDKLYTASQNFNMALQKLLADLNSAVINFTPYTVTFIQNIQTQINALNSYKSTISNVGSDFNNLFSSVLANNIITYCAPITAASLVSSPANNALASTIDTNINDRIVGNSSALINSITALTSPKSGLGQLGNWFKNPSATTVVAMQNAIIACNNIIALINAFSSKAAATITPFVTQPAQPINSAPTQAQITSLSTSLGELMVTFNNNMAPLLSVPAGLQGFRQNIQNDLTVLINGNSSLAAFLAAAKTPVQNTNLSNQILINDLIWNLQTLIGPKYLGQGSNAWWYNSSLSDSINQTITTSNALITALNNYRTSVGITYP